MSTTNIEFADGKVILANDNDCCTEAIEILSDIWKMACIDGFYDMPWSRIGAFLAAKGIIDVDTDPPDESNRNLEGEDL